MTPSDLIFFAPQLPPQDSSAAAMRLSFFQRKLQEANIKMEVWSPSPAPSVDQLGAQLPSNKSSFLNRLYREIVLGFELSLRLFKIRFSWPKMPVVMLSSPPYVTCLLTSFVCDLLRIRYILDVRDLYPEVYFSQDLFEEDSDLGRIQKKLATAFYSHSAHIITVSQGCKDLIQPYLKSQTPISVIRNGYESELFASQVSKRGPFTCIFHGNLGYMQNIALLKDVIEKTYAVNPNIKFVVAGQGPQDFVLRTITTPNFQFLGEVRQTEIPALLMGSHLGLSFRIDGTYADITFPVKVYEYIGAEIPVIHTPPGPAVNEITENKLGFLFQNDDASRIVDKINELATNQILYNQYVNQIREHKQKYSREYAAQNLIDIIKGTITSTISKS